jgi:hypothetical protein
MRSQQEERGDDDDDDDEEEEEDDDDLPLHAPSDPQASERDKRVYQTLQKALSAPLPKAPAANTGDSLRECPVCIHISVSRR